MAATMNYRGAVHAAKVLIGAEQSEVETIYHVLDLLRWAAMASPEQLIDASLALGQYLPA